MAKDYFEAWTTWLSEHQKSLDSTTLGPQSTMNTYLRNRLHEAFEAGVEFGEKRAQGKKNDP